MSRFELRNEWEVADPPEVVQARFRAIAPSLNLRVEETSGGEIAFSRGSQLMTRLAGGWFVPQERLPMEGGVTLQPVGEMTHVVGLLHDRWGLGLFDKRSARRYHEMFAELMALIRHTTEGC